MGDWGKLEKELIDDNITEVDVELNRGYISQWLKVAQSDAAKTIQLSRGNEPLLKDDDGSISSQEQSHVADQSKKITRQYHATVESDQENSDEVTELKPQKKPIINGTGPFTTTAADESDVKLEAHESLDRDTQSESDEEYNSSEEDEYNSSEEDKYNSSEEDGWADPSIYPSMIASFASIKEAPKVEASSSSHPVHSSV
jgi:hypothetical protein